MNRRDFGKMMVGSGVAAAVPVQGMAGVAAAQAQRSKYIFAVALAHSRADVSADMISERFGVRPHVARGFIRKMVRNGVVDAPNAQGIARLAEPLQRIVPQVVEYNPSGGYVVKGPLEKLKDKAMEIARDAFDEESAPGDIQSEEASRAEEVTLSGDDPEQPEVSGAARSAG